MARFLGNKSTKEVHDSNNAQTNCQLGEIEDSKTFYPDTLKQAHSEGYDNCAWCIGGSRR